jgi:hypothetical protein
MKYIAPKIISRTSAKTAIQTAKDVSVLSDGIPRMTTEPAYQADE